jgi:hypothetical protein
MDLTVPMTNSLDSFDVSGVENSSQSTPNGVIKMGFEVYCFASRAMSWLVEQR